MNLSSESKLFLGIILATIAIITSGIIFLSKPPAVLSREELVANGIKRGNPEATAHLVEFSDFQCPACASFQPAVKEILEKYQDKLLFVYRHFPLPQHSFAIKSAIAAEAAGQQGKFWEMADLLFTNQNQLSDDLVVQFAKQLSLDLTAFNEAIKSNALQEKVEADKAYAAKIGLNSTPTFFLNGKKLQLTSIADLKKAVEEELL